MISPKEKLIYEAIIRLARQGRGLHEITVSQIAGEAGIGKGTAYEYFATKEEMVARAMAYKVLQEGMALEEQVAAQNSLRDKFYTAVDCVYNNARECMLIGRAVLSAMTAEAWPEGAKRYAPASVEALQALRERVLEDLADAAEKEGLGETSREYAKTAFISAILGAIASMMAGRQSAERSKEMAFCVLKNALRADDE